MKFALELPAGISTVAGTVKHAVSEDVKVTVTACELSDVFRETVSVTAPLPAFSATLEGDALSDNVAVSLSVRSVIRPGGETRWIDLKGDKRFIKQIEMVYRSKPNFKGQATVCAYGR